MPALPIVSDQSHSEQACSASPKLKVLESSSPAPQEFLGRAAVVTLGCAKNQVDSEVMLGTLKKYGFEIVSDVEQADLAIVNTCGFLESSVKESIDCILEVAELKKSGRLRKLIVAGCMVERYQGDIESSLPEVDQFISVDDILHVAEAAGGRAELARTFSGAARPYFLYDDTVPRYLGERVHSAYVKVSEGCDRPCTFCIIPKIRGPMRSRDVDSIVREVANLGGQGVREVNLVAQDLTAFGLDRAREDRRTLADLLQALDAHRAVDWIRLLYAYPVGVTEELLEAISKLPRVVEYLDIPLQHSSEKVLKEMQRPLGKFSPRAITGFIRNKAPGIHIRTTFIVGFPGESDSDIDDLESFIEEGHFSSLGIFTYSAEQGTPACQMSGQIPEKVKQQRRERLMLAQQQVIQRKLEQLKGRTLEVLIEGPHPESDLLIAARARFQAPEVDGQVIINNIDDMSSPNIQAGSLVKVVVTEVLGYDLLATLTHETSPDRNIHNSL